MADKVRLASVIATEKTVNERAHKTITEADKASQVPSLFKGETRTYLEKNESGSVSEPPEIIKCQIDARYLIETVCDAMAWQIDIEATKDFGNTKAFATVDFGGYQLEEAPIPLLLYLERLFDKTLKTYIDRLPELDPSETWVYNENNGEYYSEKQVTERTKKIAVPVVKYEATKEHPAQTELAHEDVVIGHYHKRKHSTAIPKERKRELQDRRAKMAVAIKEARERANATMVDHVKVGKDILDQLFNS